MTTIYDVAKTAGVSPKTVSRVLNNEPYVRDTTRQRVLAAIDELDYRPNFSARQMRTQKSHAITLITDEIAITPYAIDIIKGAFEEAWKHHKLLLIVNTERDLEIERDAMEMILERQIEGIIYATMPHLSIKPPENIYKIPTVLLNCYVEDLSLPSVVPDEVKGGYTATKMLIDKGHHRIGFINNAEIRPAAIGRFKGYRQALQESDIAFDPDLVTRPPVDNSNYGYEGALQLLSLTHRPTALFCFNDRMAAGAYQALNEYHLSIPDDVAVVGFDNQEVLATALVPALTTVQLPHSEMGKWAVQHLLHLIYESNDSTSQEAVQYKKECPLVERDSA
jgi:LacI family transcriptional regulator